MAFLVQHGHGKSRAVGERKPRHGARSPTKLELRQRQLAVRLLAACLLAPVLCICAARHFSVVLPSQLSPGNGVYLAEGNHVISDDAEAAGALTSLQRGFVDDGHRLQEPSAPVPARLGADPVRGSPELDIEVESSNSKHITDLDNKSGMKGLTMSSTNASSSPENSLTNSRQSVTHIEVPKPKSKIYCDDKSKDEGFPYARPIICQMSGDVRVSPESSSVALITPMQQQVTAFEEAEVVEQASGEERSSADPGPDGGVHESESVVVSEQGAVHEQVCLEPCCMTVVVEESDDE